MDTKDLITIGILILLGLLLIWGLNKYNNRNNTYNQEEEEENLQEEEEEAKFHQESLNTNNEGFYGGSNQTKDSDNSFNVKPNESMDMGDIYQSMPSMNEHAGFPNDCFPKDQLTPEELLPTDYDSKWAQVNPAGQGELKDQNFLNAGYHVGVNTVGQTLRNANLQLRSEPPNPQVKVSPWLQTTIEPDSNRKPMEIGGCE